jgi:hypothetical protein
MGLVSVRWPPQNIHHTLKGQYMHQDQKNAKLLVTLRGSSLNLYVTFTNIVMLLEKQDYDFSKSARPIKQKIVITNFTS